MDQQVEDAARSLHKAMAGIGTDEKRLIKEIVTHSNSFRQLIKEKYLNLYGKVCKLISFHSQIHFKI